MSAKNGKVRVEFPTIYVQVQHGMVMDVIGVPEGQQVVVLDHDIETATDTEVVVSPVDGEACTMRRFG